MLNTPDRTKAQKILIKHKTLGKGYELEQQLINVAAFEVATRNVNGFTNIRGVAIE